MNEHVMSRVDGIRKALLSIYEANKAMSSASKGREREEFIDIFLSKALPPPYRFGTGDITDKFSNKSGQVDIVVEYPFLPSVPSLGRGEVRIYLSESVAAVVEVKSDVSNQWNEVVQTARNVRGLRRDLGGFIQDMHGGSIRFSPSGITIFGMHLDGRNAPQETGAAIEMGPSGVKVLGREVSSNIHIPVFVVGYTGWRSLETLKKYVNQNLVDAILILDGDGLFASGVRFGNLEAIGPASLWAMICCLHGATKELSKISTDLLSYALG